MSGNYPERYTASPSNEETAERYDLEIYGGSCRLEEAKVVCLADPNHAARITRYGAFIREIYQPGDRVLIEGYELEHAERYGVTDMEHVASWEDPAVYLLAVLVSMRDSHVARRADTASDASMAAAFLKDAPADSAEALGRAEALEAAADALARAYVHLVLELRGQILEDRFVEALGRQGRTFIIAGANHFGYPAFFADALAANIPLVGLRPAQELPDEEDLLEANRQSEEKGDRADIKELCLAILRKRGQTIASLASMEKRKR